MVFRFVCLSKQNEKLCFVLIVNKPEPNSGFEKMSGARSWMELALPKVLQKWAVGKSCPFLFHLMRNSLVTFEELIREFLTSAKWATHLMPFGTHFWKFEELTVILWAFFQCLSLPQFHLRFSAPDALHAVHSWSSQMATLQMNYDYYVIHFFVAAIIMLRRYI